MGLVVPILRLAMLFLNIYDSYKTLKDPPTSARNGSQFSQRAISQRKRDIKGCLAVWIVWCCFITYERLVEALVSIFIPFYDEIKSLVILFLIMTRARGAEPIFLHVIRPLLKPYTPTLDICLDFVCMIGDILLAIATLPFHPVLTWWQKSVSVNEGALDSESESIVDPTTQTARRGNAEPDAAARVTSRIPNGTAEPQLNADSLKFPRKVSADRQPNHRQGGSQLGRPVKPNMYPHIPSGGLPNGSSSHQIWNPPPSSYTEEDFPDDPDATIRSRKRPSVRDIFNLPPETEEAAREREEVEEWRQYPPFPSAYPPTPLVAASSRLPDNAASTIRAPQLSPDAGVLSDISEDLPQRDFRESLLPPRKPLNPGFVDGLSDDYYNPGVQSNRFDDIIVDIDSGTDEEEDAFNTTLQTPLPPLRMSRSHLHAVALSERETSIASSVASRSTALTTADNGSSLRTQSSSDSLSSASISPSELSSSVLGKKRPLPPSNITNVKRRIRLMEEKAIKNITNETSIKPAARTAHLIVPRTRNVPRRERSLSPSITIDGDTSSSSDGADDDNASDHSSYSKRRKVNISAPEAANPPRTTRARVTRYATVPTRPQQAKAFSIPPAPLRASSRIRPGSGPSALPLAPALTADSSQSGLSSTNDLPLGHRTRPARKNTTKKR